MSMNSLLIPPIFLEQEIRAVLLSINPRFTNAIFELLKSHEFRKVIWRNKVDRVYIYSTKPIGVIQGYFKVNEIIQDSIPHLYEICVNDDNPVLSEKEFFKYFGNKQTGFAIKINNLVEFKNPPKLKDISIKRAPQNFCYLNSKQIEFLNSLEAKNITEKQIRCRLCNNLRLESEIENKKSVVCSYCLKQYRDYQDAHSHECQDCGRKISENEFEDHGGICAVCDLGDAPF